VLQVRVHEQHRVAVAQGVHASGEGHFLAKVPGQPQARDVGGAGRKLLDRVPGAVHAAVVDKEQLPAKVWKRGENGFEAGVEHGEVARLVEDRNDDGDRGHV